MITIRFACGHVVRVEQMLCPTCGEHRIAQVLAPPPRFSGMATGPYADFKALEPVAVDLTTKESGNGTRDQF